MNRHKSTPIIIAFVLYVILFTACQPQPPVNIGPKLDTKQPLLTPVVSTPPTIHSEPTFEPTLTVRSNVTTQPLSNIIPSPWANPVYSTPEAINNPTVTSIGIQTVPIPQKTNTFTAPNRKPSYTEAKSIITTYFSFISQGKYEDSYQMLSPYMKQNGDFNSYKEGLQTSIKSIEIISIEPYLEWVKKQGLQVNSKKSTDGYFTVTLIFTGYGTMAGSTLSGETHIRFISLVNIDGEWKINSFDSAH